MDSMGASMEVAKYTERLVPSTRFVAVDGVAPVVSETATFVAPSASVIGDVTLGSNSSIWYGATVRGDVNKLTIGEYSSIGDRAVVHVAKIQGDFSTSIGNHVTVGPCAVVHACVLQDKVIIGASAQVLDGSVVESLSMVAAGSVVTPGTKVTGGELWAGSPAKKVRALTDEEKAAIAEMATDQAELAAMHAFENSKDYQQLAADEEELRDSQERHEEYIQPKDWKDNDDVLGQGQPGFIFNSTLTHPEEGLKLLQKKQDEQQKQ